MPTRNSAAFNKRNRATASSSTNEPTIPLPYGIFDEANRIWYNAKLRNRLVGRHSPLYFRESSRCSRASYGYGILGLPYEGYLVFFERASTCIFAEPNWVYSDALARFGIQAQAIGKKVVKSNGLEGTWKVASLLIGTNIAPRSPNRTNDMRMIDVYIMNKMRSFSPFSLSSLLILFLRDVACIPMPDSVIGFPLLLSHIFHNIHVEFSGEL
ncbi:hypothetical protein M9H77_26752 [Catharanthus roseus]|uniref:Uncharacterized protein n=1 Tax=Catharanthus roseus TaxID=4058 RepID=A0ACC0ACR3_CATRO|nr:hypothetical protein M9H77_26752 [Catharanthus roseus]